MPLRIRLSSCYFSAHHLSQVEEDRGPSGTGADHVNIGPGLCSAAGLFDLVSSGSGGLSAEEVDMCSLPTHRTGELLLTRN